MQIVLPYMIRNSVSNCSPSWKGGDRGGWRTKDDFLLSPPGLPLLRGGIGNANRTSLKDKKL